MVTACSRRERCVLRWVSGLAQWGSDHTETGRLSSRQRGRAEGVGSQGQQPRLRPQPGLHRQIRRFLVLQDRAPCVSRVCARGGAQMLLRLSHLCISVRLTDAPHPHLPASAVPGLQPRARRPGPQPSASCWPACEPVPGDCPGRAGSPGPASSCDCLPEETSCDVYLSRTMTRTQTPCRHISELKARGREVKNQSAACPGQLRTPLGLGRASDFSQEWRDTLEALLFFLGSWSPSVLGMRPAAPRPSLVTSPRCPLVPTESLPAPDILLTPQLPELPANGPTHPRALCAGGWGPQAEDSSPRAPREWRPGSTRARGDPRGQPQSWAASDSS